MRKYLLSILVVLFSLFIVFPSSTASAANGKVTLKSYSYKGQPYVQVVNHPNKNAASKMNKALKAHAVNAASVANSSDIKQNKDYYYKTSVQTAYNKQGALSVVYYSYVYTGGIHDMQWVESFNFNSSNGNRIYMKDFLDSRTKIVRANVYLQSILKKRSQANPGSILYTDTILDIQKGTFFYNDKGFTVRFNPYEVAPFSEGFVDVYIPYDIIVNGQNTAPVKPQKPQITQVSGVLASDIHVYSNDLKTFLGTLSTNTYDRDSIFNEYGTYGSQYNRLSIWNSYGNYGSSYSSESAFNEYTSTPPVLVYKGEVFGYVTSNTYLTNGISPSKLLTFAKSL
ncbi:hypothetical protein CXK86_19625 [Paenibacillus sp. BGI2013]|uniref:DUF3298 and DUF4163 domain-containing protein n=1 Tax=Paenibacillus sp. BGI2013 TaxID=2058902 RepID=UPI000C6ED331|nr:DUF3298 and DUF4163 domain-containing protein [Paenibacillus sp. BGI2013]PKQ89264.1 hypothetical protein CXK86_19625 [Paenibacillus sp. BGI2013]